MSVKTLINEVYAFKWFTLEKESLHTKNRVSHMHNDNIANALNTLLFINAHYFQPMRKQNCLYFGDKQTEIKLLKHAIVYEHVLGL